MGTLSKDGSEGETPSSGIGWLEVGQSCGGGNDSGGRSDSSCQMMTFHRALRAELEDLTPVSLTGTSKQGFLIFIFQHPKPEAERLPVPLCGGQGGGRAGAGAARVRPVTGSVSSSPQAGG